MMPRRMTPPATDKPMMRGKSKGVWLMPSSGSYSSVLLEAKGEKTSKSTPWLSEDVTFNVAP